MTTTISPSLGHGPWTQQGVGATPGYDAIDFRRTTSPGLQEGVITAGSYEVTQRAAGANLSVDIAATTGDGAIVQGDAVTGQGLYVIGPHSAVINEAITTAHATLPRIDQVVLEVKDTQHDASGSNLAQVRVVAGTATGGATLDNRTGAAALPSSAIRLADVLVAATDTAISNSEIRDRRSWARGAYKFVMGSGAAHITTTSTTPVVLTGFSGFRLEASGGPLALRFSARTGHSVLGTTVVFYIYEDGVQLGAPRITTTDTTDGPHLIAFDHIYTPTAGSHVYDVRWNGGAAGTSTVYNTTGGAGSPSLEIIEHVRQNTVNNATTSG